MQGEFEVKISCEFQNVKKNIGFLCKNQERPVKIKKVDFIGPQRGGVSFDQFSSVVVLYIIRLY